LLLTEGNKASEGIRLRKSYGGQAEVRSCALGCKAGRFSLWDDQVDGHGAEANAGPLEFTDDFGYTKFIEKAESLASRRGLAWIARSIKPQPKIYEVMGAHPYYYFVKYQPDVEAALQDLRQREFEAGRYNPVQPFPRFPIHPNSAAPGAQHVSIEEAQEEAAEDGTRSILDIGAISEEPDFCVAAPLPDQELQRHFGTVQPTNAMVSRKLDFLRSVERSHCVYITVYEDGQPRELFFGGYSFD